jgi:tetratricopeptide (TPR) repeat protein
MSISRLTSRSLTSSVLAKAALGLVLLGAPTLLAGPPPPPAPGGTPPPPPSGTPATPPPATGTAPAAPPTAPPVAPDAPSAGPNAQGESQYKGEDYEAAAIQVHKIYAGELPGDKARAQFWLGKTLYKLKFYSASLAIFDEIVQAGPAHPFHKLTLPWLASLARELPEGAEVLQKIGRYKPTDLEDEAFDEVRDELYYLLGRFYYEKGDLAQGVALLDQVPSSSDYYIPAQFFLGVAHTRNFQGEPAVEAFKNVLRHSIELRQREESNKKKNKKAARKAKSKNKKNKKRRGRRDQTATELSFQEEMRQYEHLAALGLANIFYMVGKFDTAIKYLDKIPLESPYFLDAVHWAAWAEFRKVEIDDQNANRHYQRTLGYVHTLNAPFFEDYLYPDALKLKAVTYYFNCRYDSAKRTVDEFNRRYPTTMEKLQSILEQAPEDFKLYELARKIIDEKSGLDPFVEQVAQKALQDKQLSKYFAYVDELEREQQQYDDMSSAFKSAGVGERVTEDLDLALSAAREATGAEARERITGQIREIKELNKEMIKVEYEILEKRKQQGALDADPDKAQKPKIDSEHEIYNYNGEYWQDELGYYRYKVTNLCKQ